MITPNRLEEIATTPREASIFKAEAKELVDAYRALPSGARIKRDADGSVWLHVEAPSGKKASICLDVLAVRLGGITCAALLEWANAIPILPKDPTNV